jgi:deglycase
LPMPGRLAGKQILMVIAPENFRDEEYAEPRRIFERELATVRVASTRVTQARGMLGTKVNVHSSLEGLKVQDYAAVVIVGGAGAATHLWNDPTLKALVQDAAKTKRVVGAICYAPVVLAKAGLLTGKKATFFDDEASRPHMEQAGATLESTQTVVRDGSIVTGHGPDAAKEFGETVVETILGINSKPT